MSENDAGDGRTRSSFELKKTLLKRAWEGKSRFTGSEMLARIQEATRRAREIPEEHQETLDDIKATSAAIQDCLLRAEERKASGALQDPPRIGRVYQDGDRGRTAIAANVDGTRGARSFAA